MTKWFTKELYYFEQSCPRLIAYHIYIVGIHDEEELVICMDRVDKTRLQRIYWVALTKQQQ